MHRVPASQLCRHLAVRKASVAWDTRTRHSLFEAVSGADASVRRTVLVATLTPSQPCTRIRRSITLRATFLDILDRSVLLV